MSPVDVTLDAILPWIADVAATLARTLVGIAMTIVVGWPLGLLLGRAPRLWRAVEPLVELVRAIPPALAFPLALLWLGYGEGARVATVAFGTCGIVVLHVAGALDRAPCARRDTVRLAGLGRLATLRVLDVPESLPALLLGARIALAHGLVVAVVGEMLVGTRHGLGARAMDSLVAYDVGRLIAVIALGGALGMASSMTLAALERRLVPWARHA